MGFGLALPILSLMLAAGTQPTMPAKAQTGRAEIPAAVDPFEHAETHSLDSILNELPQAQPETPAKNTASPSPWKGDTGKFDDETRKAAKDGNVLAQTRLGAAYSSGARVQQDYAEAARWFRKAADQGNADAQACLGSAYYLGNGVPQDYTEAVRWFRKAADQGNTTAQYFLGDAYFKGQGVAQDFAEAARLWRMAAD